MLSMIGLSEAMYSICVAVVIIVPRTSSSSQGCIGGDLAAPFRKCVLMVVLMNVFRNTFFDDRRFRDAISASANSDGSSSSSSTSNSTEEIATLTYYALTSIESFASTFLMLLMPYLLQCQLSAVINIKPGQNLVPWLLVTLFFNFSGVIAARSHPNMWSIKRMGDAIGSIPVIKTLQLFRRVNATRGGNNITIKTVEVLECFAFVITTSAAVAYFYDDHQSDVTLAVRVSSNFVSSTRLMLHGLVLNVMDEASQTASPTSPEKNEPPVGNNNNNNKSDDDTEMAMLVVKSPRGQISPRVVPN